MNERCNAPPLPLFQRLSDFINAGNTVLFSRLDDPHGQWHTIPSPAFDDGLTAVRFRGALWVFGTSNKKVQFNIFNNMAWGGWATMAEGFLLGKPSAAVHNNSLVIFGRGTDSAIYYNTHTEGWSGWRPYEHEGATLSAPAVVSTHGVLHVVVRGTDQMIYHSAGTPWKSIGALTSDAPALAALDHALVLLYKSAHNSIHTSTFNLASGNWAPPTLLSGAASSGPALTFDGTSNVIALVRGTDNGLYRAVYSDGRFLPWSAVAGAANVTHSPTLA